MSELYPPTPNEPEPGGATPAPGGHPPSPDGPSGSSAAGGSGDYPPAAGQGDYPPAAGQGDYSTSGAPTEPLYTTPADIAPPPPQAGQGYLAAGSGRPAASMSGDQVKVAFQNANRLDLGIIGAGLLAFIFSLFPYYTSPTSIYSASAWHGFFGWFGVLLGLSGAVLVVLPLLGVRLGIPTRMAALGVFAAATLSTLLALFIDPAQGGKNVGRGFGFWATFVMVIVGTVLCVIRKDAVD
jgi:hypothetical protein